jgi:hypothetical protein
MRAQIETSGMEAMAGRRIEGGASASNFKLKKFV